MGMVLKQKLLFWGPLTLALRCMPGGDVHFHLQKEPFDGPKLTFYLAVAIVSLVGHVACAPFDNRSEREGLFVGRFG